VKRSWIFLKLRMLQLKSDKTALFFCYVLPVLLLLGVGYPLQRQDKPVIAVAYTDAANTEASAAFLQRLQGRALLEVTPYAKLDVPAQQALINNDIKHYLALRAGPEDRGGFVAHLYANSLGENQVENTALRTIVDESLRATGATPAQPHELRTARHTSYVVTLLPGLIGMTLLIVGLNGFGGVLIEERDHGLFKNIKTIDASPVPFIAGLLVSRLLVCYSVAIALMLIGVLVFGIPTDVNYLLLLVVITLGCMAFLGLGLVLAIASPSVTAFNGIVNFVQMPLILLGGVFFSVSAYPDWLQAVTRALPLTQLNAAMRELLFGSVGFRQLGQLAAEMGVLAAWCLVTLAFARLRFKW
jgi:ABC-type multidrug transport system permease subunit